MFEGAVVVEVEGQQAVETGRVTIADAKGIAELSNAGSPAGAVVQSDMAPAEAGIVGKIVVDHPSPIANGVIDRGSRKTVSEQLVAIGRRIVLVGPGIATRNVVLVGGLVVDLDISLIDVLLRVGYIGRRCSADCH